MYFRIEKYGKIKLTKKAECFLRENHSRMNNQQLADAIGMRLTKLRGFLYEMGLKRMELEYWRPAMVRMLRKIYKVKGDTEIAEIFNKRFSKKKGWTKKHIEKKRRYLKLKRSDRQKRKIKIRNVKSGMFSKSHWKRWDRRVHAPGDIVIWNLSGGYKIPHIKTELRSFIKLSHYIWAEVNGPIPKGMMIAHKDGDTMNCELSNLFILSKADNARRNAAASSGALSDKYIQGILRQKGEPLPQGIIELKRQQLLLNREISKTNIYE